MTMCYSFLPSAPSKPHLQLCKEWNHGWKPKSWVSLNLQDKTNNCDQNQNPQTIATKELDLKKFLWNLKTNGAVQHTYLICTVSASLRKKEVKENNSCLMGPETRQSHTSQQNSQRELAGQYERRKWRWKVYALQPTSPGQTARSKVQGGQLTQEPTVSRDYQASTQTWAGHRTQEEKDEGPKSKKRGTKRKSQNRDPASLACLTEQMILLRNCLDTCWKPTDAEGDGIPLSVYPDLTFTLSYLLWLCSKFWKWKVWALPPGCQTT